MSAGAPTWPKPDYARWDLIEEFNEREAAYLLCDIDPHAGGAPVAQAMERQLAGDADAGLIAPTRTTDRPEYQDDPRDPYGPQIIVTRRGTWFYSRGSLEQYARDRDIAAPAFRRDLRQREPSKANAEGKARELLAEMMGDPDKPPRSKAECWEEIRTQVPGLSHRAFGRAWQNAEQDVFKGAPNGWTAPGPKAKRKNSDHRPRRTRQSS